MSTWETEYREHVATASHSDSSIQSAIAAQLATAAATAGVADELRLIREMMERDRSPIVPSMERKHQ